MIGFPDNDPENKLVKRKKQIHSLGEEIFTNPNISASQLWAKIEEKQKGSHFQKIQDHISVLQKDENNPIQQAKIEALNAVKKQVLEEESIETIKWGVKNRLKSDKVKYSGRRNNPLAFFLCLAATLTGVGALSWLWYAKKSKTEKLLTNTLKLLNIAKHYKLSAEKAVSYSSPKQLKQEMSERFAFKL